MSSTLQEITHGVLRTDANGRFELGFDALPDRVIPVASDPRFDYRVYTDVTDINGETRSASTTIVAGYSIYDLSIRLDRNEAMTADSLRAIRVDVSNLAGEPVPAVVHLAAYPLQAPNRLIRQRLWTVAPDRWVMSEQAFIDSFPHDPYREELRKETWPKGAAAWEGVDSTGGQPVALRLKPGWWEIEATTTDSTGHVAKDLRYIELYDNQTGGPVNPEYLWGAGHVADGSGEPGEMVRIETASSAKDIFIVRQLLRAHLFLQSNYQYTRVSNDDDPLKYRYLTATSGQRVDNWSIAEADRGGFGVADAFVKDNRLYVHRTVVQIPWNNKELQIHYTSFRDKTEPGSAEKWAVRISGWRGSRAAAQVLASMYDASLDQFEGQSWAVPHLYPSMDAVNAWQNIDDFKAFWANSQGRPGQAFPGQPKSYDRLMTVGNLGLDGKLSGLRHDAIIERNLVYDKVPLEEVVVTGYSSQARTDMKLGEEYRGEEMLEKKAESAAAPSAPPLVQVRTNFQETAFFFPDLRTDSVGNVSFSFTMPQSLTQWKWMTLAHTRDLAFGYSEKTVVTQKQLMVQPNVPRFLREGDKVNLSVRLST
jgi:hypothetical protein